MKKLQEFRAKLNEIFEIDKAELDFGIYRIINQKRTEITNFMNNIEKDVRGELKNIGNLSIEDKKQELEEKIKQIKELGYNPDENLQVIELRNNIENSVDISAVESDIYSHLSNFFSRYYSEGDFISQRRYKDDVYALPYEGEEVKLHWANYDQYYIKTSEDFNNYVIKLNDKMKLHFKVVDATQEKNNNKEKTGKERRFSLIEENPIEITESEIIIKFEFDLNKETQKILNKKSSETAMNLIREENLELFELLAKEKLNSQGKSYKDKFNIFEYELNNYTAKNSFDYFIHKDLGGFLRRELDFYIKNEVMFIDDLDEERIKNSIAKVKAIKKIGQKIIQLLEQLENFQKKLWEKKKFVTETNYCLTIDKIFEKFEEEEQQNLLDEIIANEEQIEEWKEMYDFDFSLELEKGNTQEGLFQTSVSKHDLLKQNDKLVIDTKFFTEMFKERIISGFDDLEEELNGLMIHSDNYQALNLLQGKYQKNINCIHIDPPYNTATSGFLYKNNYKRSSWLTMMDNRIFSSLNLLSNLGSYQCHIDENEYEYLHLLFNKTNLNNAGTVIWDKRNPMNGGNGIANQHEYLIWRTNQIGPQYLRNKSILSIIEKVKILIQNAGEVNEKVKQEFSKWIKSNKELSGGEKAYCYIDNEGRIYQSVSLRAPELRKDKKFHKPLIHPLTKKACSVPPNGFSRTPETLQEMIDRGEILFGKDETTQPRQKSLLTEDKRRQISSVMQNANKGKANINPLGLEFPYNHPISLYEDFIGSVTKIRNEIVLDFFAGSATTGHAVINLNMEDNLNRKYILIEMGEYFDIVTKPRMKKIIHSREWKNGKPILRDGISQIFKYIKLEQYEDTLNNLIINQTPQQKELFGKNSVFEEDYMLNYMIDFETKDSPSLLNLEMFDKPFEYKMKIIEKNEIKYKNIDLVETFNFLIGLNVNRVEKTRYFEYENSKLRENVDSSTFAVKEVTGITREGKKILIIWRNRTTDKALDNVVIEEYFRKQRYNTLDMEFDRVYINGDNTLQNIRKNEEFWKVELIEEKFKKMMFEEQTL